MEDYWLPFQIHIRAPYKSSEATGDVTLFGLPFLNEG